MGQYIACHPAENTPEPSSERATINRLTGALKLALWRLENPAEQCKAQCRAAYLYDLSLIRRALASVGA